MDQWLLAAVVGSKDWVQISIRELLADWNILNWIMVDNSVNLQKYIATFTYENTFYGI